MHKSTAIQLSIHQPCSQNWEEMSINGTGRFCDSCNKSVIDFTAYSDQQLADFFKRSKEHMCGKFRNDQLEKPLYPLKYSQNRPFPQFLINAALVIGLSSSANAKEKQVSTIIHVEQKETKEEKEVNEVVIDSAGYFFGQVIDMKTKETIPGATALMEGTTLATATDINGFFKLDVSDRLDADTIKVIVSALGYETQTIRFSPKATPLNQVIEMKYNGAVLGGIEISHSREPRTGPGYSITFRYRVKNWLNKWFRHKTRNNG